MGYQKIRNEKPIKKRRVPQNHSPETVSYSSITFGDSWKTSHTAKDQINEEVQPNVAEDNSNFYSFNQFYGSEEQSHQHATQIAHRPAFSQAEIKKPTKHPKKLFVSTEDEFKSAHPYDFSIKNNFPSHKSKSKKFHTDLGAKNLAINTKHNQYDSRHPFRDSNSNGAPKKVNKQVSENFQGQKSRYRPSASSDSVENSRPGYHRHVHNKRQLQDTYVQQRKSAKRKVKELRMQRQILERRKRKLLEEERKLASEAYDSPSHVQATSDPSGRYYMRIDY